LEGALRSLHLVHPAASISTAPAGPDVIGAGIAAPPASPRVGAGSVVEVVVVERERNRGVQLKGAGVIGAPTSGFGVGGFAGAYEVGMGAEMPFSSSPTFYG
ncbi:hypothetical protein HK101_005516, partial [Irineochytrium annulatum]